MTALKLSDDLVTRQDLQSAILELRGYATWAERSAVKRQVTKGAADDEPPPVSAAAAGLISQWHIDKEITPKSLGELIKAMEDLAAAAVHVTITLAAPAPAELKHEIVTWFRRSVRPDILVDFRFNSTMLGGMMVACGSRVFDWSFKRQILAGRQKFPEELRSV